MEANNIQNGSIKSNILIFCTVFLLLFKDVLPFLQSPLVQAGILITILLCSFKFDFSTDVKWYGIFFLIAVLGVVDSTGSKLFSPLANTFLNIIVLSALINSKEAIEKFLVSFSLIGVCLFLYLIIRYYSILGHGRLGDYMYETTYGSSIQFSYYIISIICASFILLFINDQSNKWVKIIAIACVILGFVVSIFNGAKKGYITPLFFLLLYTFIKNRKNAFKLVIYLSVICVVIYVVWEQIRNIDLLQRYFVNRVESMIAVFTVGANADEDGSTTTRMSYIPVALNAFIDSPIWGLGGFANATKYFYKAIGVSHPHNDFLNLLAAGGLILFVAFYWFPFKLLWCGIKSVKKDTGSIVFFAMIITLLFNNLNSQTYNIPVINIWYVIAYKYYKTKHLYS